MGLFSQDRPRIPGDPPHLEIMTKIGHALPNAARKTLAASAYVGKGRIKDAVRVMKRKSIPKLEEGIVEKIKKWNASGKKRTRYDGNDPYEDAPKQDIKKTMKEEQINEISSELAGKASRKIKAKLDKKFDDAPDGVPKDDHAKRLMKMSVRAKNPKYNDALNKSRKKKLDEVTLTRWQAKKLTKRMDKKLDDRQKQLIGKVGPTTRDDAKKLLGDKEYNRKNRIYNRAKYPDYDKATTALRRKRAAGQIEEANHVNGPAPSKEFLKAWKKHKESKAGQNADKDFLKAWKNRKDAGKKKSHFEKKLGYKPGKIDESIVKKIKRAFNKVTGIQRAGLAHKTEKDYKDATNRSDAYHDTYKHYQDRYGKSKKKFDKASMDWYKNKRDKTDDRIKDLDKRSRRIDNAGKLEEAQLNEISKKLAITTYGKMAVKGKTGSKLGSKIAKKWGLETKFHADDHAAVKVFGHRDPEDQLEKHKAKKKLQEAVSRKLIARKNAEKQRLKYVTRKGEMPPIITPKSRYKFTGKELGKLNSVLDKQKSRRSEAKSLAMEIKKGVKTKANVPAVPESSRASSVSTFAKLPTPGFHPQNAQPHVTDMVRAHQTNAPKKSDKEGDLLRGFNTWSGEFAKSGNPRHLELAKTAALTHYAAMIAKISHHPGHVDYDTARAHADTMLNAHMSALNRLKDHVPERIEAPKKKGFVSKIKGLFRK